MSEDKQKEVAEALWNCIDEATREDARHVAETISALIDERIAAREVSMLRATCPRCENNGAINAPCRDCGKRAVPLPAKPEPLSECEHGGCPNPAPDHAGGRHYCAEHLAQIAGQAAKPETSGAQQTSEPALTGAGQRRPQHPLAGGGSEEPALSATSDAPARVTLWAANAYDYAGVLWQDRAEKAERAAEEWHGAYDDVRWRIAELETQLVTYDKVTQALYDARKHLAASEREKATARAETWREVADWAQHSGACDAADAARIRDEAHRRELLAKAGPAPAPTTGAGRLVVTGHNEFGHVAPESPKCPRHGNTDVIETMTCGHFCRVAGCYWTTVVAESIDDAVRKSRLFELAKAWRDTDTGDEVCRLEAEVDRLRAAEKGGAK